MNILEMQSELNSLLISENRVVATYHTDNKVYIVDVMYGRNIGTSVDSNGLPITTQGTDFIMPNYVWLNVRKSDYFVVINQRYNVTSIDGELWRYTDESKTAVRIHVIGANNVNNARNSTIRG